MERLFGQTDGEEITSQTLLLNGPLPARLELSLRLGHMTDLQTRFFRRGPGRRRMLSLAIRGLPFTDHAQARDALESYGNALLFQIDAKTGVAMQLLRERNRRPIRPTRDSAAYAPLEFPRAQYDEEPMSLFWYGRSASGMPLLQFLAYYQVIEFYFPQYAEAELRQRLRNTLKDPAFDPHSDQQIGRLVSAFTASGGRSTRGDELAQLRATLAACVTAQDIRAFATADDNTYFESKVKGLTSATLRAAAADDELVSKTAERIYEIRCKIVHTKADGSTDVDLLLPYSREADKLGPEIALAEFLARRVIAAGGKTL